MSKFARFHCDWPKSWLCFDPGYGDFCFGLAADICSHKILVENETLDNQKNNLVSVNLDPSLGMFSIYYFHLSKQRTVNRKGTFSFFNLPVEVRRNILELLCAPFFTRELESTILHLALYPVRDYTSDWKTLGDFIGYRYSGEHHPPLLEQQALFDEWKRRALREAPHIQDDKPASRSKVAFYWRKTESSWV